MGIYLARVLVSYLLEMNNISSIGAAFTKPNTQNWKVLRVLRFISLRYIYTVIKSYKLSELSL